MYIRVVGKMQDQHFNVKLSSNPGEKVLILVKSRGQICTIVFHLFWTLSLGLENKKSLKFLSGIVPTYLTNMVMLENCRNNISMYVWVFSNPGDKILILVENYGARISESNIYCNT